MRFIWTRVRVLVILATLTPAAWGAVPTPDPVLEETAVQLTHADPTVRRDAVRRLTPLAKEEYVLSSQRPFRPPPKYLPLLIRALDDADPRVRLDAVGAVRAVGSPSVIGPLIERLHDHQEAVRHAATDTLLTFVQYPHLLSFLSSALMSHPHPQTRLHAAGLLAAINHPTVPYALRRALRDRQLKVRRAATAALAALPSPLVVPGLLEALTYRDPATRRLAHDALEKRWSANSMAGFPESLQDAHVGVRGAAAAFLSARMHPTLVPLMTDALGSHDPRVREAAAAFLRAQPAANTLPAFFTALASSTLDARVPLLAWHPHRRHPSVAPVLVSLFTASQDDSLAADAYLSWVVPLPEFPADTVAQACSQALRHRDPGVRQAAVWTLTQLTGVRTAAALRAVADDQDPGVKLLVSWGSATLPWPALSEALVHPNQTIQVAALASLARLPPDALQHPAALSLLVAAARVPAYPLPRRHPVRRAALDLLASRPEPAALAALTASTQDPDPGARRIALWALGRRKDPAALPALARAFTLGDPRQPWKPARTDQDALQTFWTTAWALAQFSDPAAVAALVDALKEGEDWFRHAPAWALTQLPPAVVVPTLLRALERPGVSNEDIRVRQAAGWALTQTTDSDAIPLLLGAMASPFVSVRETALDTLAQLDDPRVHPALLAALEDPDSRVRLTALGALEERPSPDATAAITRVADADTDPEVTAAARRILAAHGEEPLPLLKKTVR